MIRWIVKRVIDALEAEGVRLRPIVLTGLKLGDEASAALRRAEKREAEGES